jgi:protein-tyrosine phosphatase
MKDQLFNPDGLTLLPFGLPGNIYRSPMPFRKSDTSGALLEQYQEAEVRAVVVLVETDEISRKSDRDLLKVYADHSMDFVHCPIPDFSVPSEPEELRSALYSVQTLAKQGKNVAIHCYAGYGRTGLFMGCLAKAVFGFTGEQAIAWVRKYIPTALENKAQEAYVLEFEPGGHHADPTC